MLSQICIENLTGTPGHDYVEVIYRYDERTTHDLSARENELFQTNVKKKKINKIYSWIILLFVFAVRKLPVNYSIKPVSYFKHYWENRCKFQHRMSVTQLELISGAGYI